MAESRPTWFYITGAAAALAVIVALYVVAQRTGARPASPSPTLIEKEKSYLREIVVSNVHMSAAENLLGATATYLDVQVTNRGARPVRQLEIQLEFRDALNQVVLRETADPITRRAPPLKPGESRAFRATFDHMPADWNRTPPTITTTQVHF